MKKYTVKQKRERIQKMVIETKNIIWFKMIRENVIKFNEVKFKAPNKLLELLLILFGGMA